MLSLFVLKFHDYEHVRTVFTNKKKIIYSGQMYKPWYKPSLVMLLIEKRRLADAQYLILSSRLQIFLKLCVLKNLAAFQKKHLCWSLFL